MSVRDRFEAYITKYALTRGILVRQVELCTDIAPDMVTNIANEWHEHYHRNDWHRTRQDAIERAEQMRSAKLESLRKQITKLEKLKIV